LPGLAALAEAWEADQAREQAEREAKWADQRKAEAEADAPLLKAMKERAARLRAEIPEDVVLVTVTQTGDLDGDAILNYSAEGVTLRWDQVTVQGWACAIRPGALGAFRSVCVAWISGEDLAAIKREQVGAEEREKEATEQKKAVREAKFARARETGEPVELERWTETRRVKEGGEWGEYLFVRRRLAMADGSVEETAVNTY